MSRTRFYMRVFCMDCKRFIYLKRCQEEFHNKVSHGLCEICLEKRNKEMDEEGWPIISPKGKQVGQ